jgi:glucose-6-phosphate 1-dehydrogenase
MFPFEEERARSPHPPAAPGPAGGAHGVHVHGVADTVSCLSKGPLNPFTLVVFGATGDLAKRKLAPALWGLFHAGVLPDSFRIVGCARSPLSSEDLRALFREAVGAVDSDKWIEFAQRVHYHRIDFSDESSFDGLARLLSQPDAEALSSAGLLLYLAIPPSLYETTVEMAGRTIMAQRPLSEGTRIGVVVEKPFGRDLNSARRLNRSLTRYFGEDRIFRIDHYLAKETVQNVSVLRFANAIFEPLWNRVFVDRVRITAAESLGVENRVSYYEEAGVLRDMFQNHMMMLLALTAMEPPAHFDAECFRDEIIKVFRSLRPFAVENLSERVILGQYTEGVVEGKRLRGYRELPGVAPDSLTPTYAAMEVYVDNWRWREVPFVLVSGKALAEKRTEIVVDFKAVPHSMFRGAIGEEIAPNRLILGIHPEEKIELTFQTKSPGAKLCLQSVTMRFGYERRFQDPKLDAYQKAILDCLEGDQTLFWREDAIEACWAFFEPLLEACESCGNRAQRLTPYAAGTMGPEVTEAGLTLSRNFSAPSEVFVDVT